ncbi:MAG: LamG domain-containing protein, partial [Nanoarchaeota archaeon]|nr:LamG domain-containing protein [Nanoarchaeota archaeon]
NLFQFNVTVVNSLGSEVFFKPRNTSGTQLSITDLVSVSTEDNYTVIAKCSDQVNSAETHVKYQLELTAPTFTQNATNGSDATRKGEDVQFTVNWTDAHPAQFLFCFGDGVNCINNTPQTYTSGQLMTVTKTITAVHNQQVRWQFYANDTVGNVNSTPLSFFTIANTPPTAPSISYTAPPIAFSDSFLNCSASGSTDADNESISFFYQFRDTDDLTIVQAFSINNTLNCNIAGCNQGDTIFCHAKANDGFNDSAEGSAASIFINNAAPTQGMPLLTGGSNFTNETLICTNVSTFDADNDQVKNIFNWYVDGKSIMELNLPFEGVPGANTLDYSPRHNNGTEQGAIVWNSSGGFDGKGAYEFDGVNDFINLSKPSSLLALNTSLSVEAWVFSDNNAGQHLIMDNCENFATEGYCLLLVDNEFRFHVGKPGAPKAVAAGIQTGRWYHLVGTYDNVTVKMYLDGSLINSTAAAGPLQTAGDEDIVIGFNSPANANYFDGRIDDLRVWNRALSAVQVLNLFNNKSNEFAAAETVRLQRYLCSITPNDGFTDGIGRNSSSLLILNSVPAAVSLLNPAAGFSAGVLPEFNWTVSADLDPEDSVRYIIQVDNNSDFASLEYTNTSSANRDGNVTLDRTRINTYFWRVFATDGIGNSTISDIRNFTYARWGITFNVTSGEDDSPLNNITITSCNFIGFSQGGDTSNPYGPFGFPPGNWQCTFEDTLNEVFFDRTQTFIADSDKLVDITMSISGGLTFEEHTWLEAIYNCAILKQCDLYNLLLGINQTVGNIWEQTKPTDNSVITSETITNKIVNSTHNLTIDYTVNIPIKAGYPLGAYLPVRIGYWFLNTANTTCHNQGDRPTGVANPYCQPLMIETIGPMGGSVSFTVKLQPSLPAGDYSIKRIIDIDPQGVWINYGQEEIDTITVTEDITSFGASLERTGEENPLLNDNQGSSASTGGGGGSSGGSGGNYVTNIINNIYNNITKVIKEVITAEDKDTSDHEEKPVSEPVQQSSGLEGITTATISNLNPNRSLIGFTGLVMIIIILTILGMSSWRKKYPPVELYYKDKSNTSEYNSKSEEIITNSHWDAIGLEKKE